MPQFYEIGLFEPELKEIINILQGKNSETRSEYTQQDRDKLAERLTAELWAPYYQSVAIGRNKAVQPDVLNMIEAEMDIKNREDE